ncbi:MAG: 30S ribosomal protein S9 [bacterium]
MVKKTKNVLYYEGVGRRKTSVALVRLYIPGKDKTVMVGETKIKEGEVWVNNKKIEEMFPALYQKVQYLKPLKIVKAEDRFCISITVSGGGKNGQLDAIGHGLARALEKTDKETVRPLLKKEMLLKRDPRARQRRKVGTGGKARRAKQSPKR